MRIPWRLRGGVLTFNVRPDGKGSGTPTDAFGTMGTQMRRPFTPRGGLRGQRGGLGGVTVKSERSVIIQINVTGDICRAPRRVRMLGNLR